MPLFRACVTLPVLLVAATSPADTRVVLRQAQGDKTLAPRFYQVAPNGPVATAYAPAETDTFEALPGAGVQRPAFRDAVGRLFVPDRPVIVYNYAEVPPTLRTTLGSVVRAVVAAELVGKPYDKTRVKKKEEYVDLPAPTLRNLKRTKRHRILATEEEYQIQARLEDPPRVEITQLPWLTQHDRPDRGVLMVVVHSAFPVAGRVRYKVPSVLNVSTGYRAAVSVEVVAELRAERQKDALRLDAPEVLRVDVRLDRLDLSNDVLHAAKKPIRDFLNEEARRKHDRIRQQANKAIRKAVDDQTFRLPLLQYLLPQPASTDQSPAAASQKPT